jgi:hypothetical protein
MTQDEAMIVLNETKGFCERNIGNRLSEDLCNALLSRVQSIIKIDQQSQPTSAAQEAVRPQEVGNALP